MSNKLAFWLFVVIAGVAACDVFANETRGIVFLGRQGLDLIQYLAFWR